MAAAWVPGGREGRWYGNRRMAEVTLLVCCGRHLVVSQRCAFGVVVGVVGVCPQRCALNPLRAASNRQVPRSFPATGRATAGAGPAAGWEAAGQVREQTAVMLALSANTTLREARN